MEKRFTRPYQIGDEEKIVELLDAAFMPWPQFDLKCAPIEHWKWKYLDNPIKENSIALCTLDDQVIGSFHNVHSIIKLGNRETFSCLGADVAVHPNFRRLGIHNQVNDFSEELRKKNGIKFAYGITSNPILLKKYAEIYYSLPIEVVNLVKIEDIDLHLKKMPTEKQFLKKSVYRAISLGQKIKNAFSVSDYGESFKVSKINQFSEEINDFWDIIKDDFTFITKKSRNYLNWRYCDLKGGDYNKFIIEENGEVLGYIILRINKFNEDYPIGFIIDLLTLSDQDNIADALMTSALQHFHDEGVNIIQSIVVKGSLIHDVLKRFKFIDSRTKARIDYMTYNGSNYSDIIKSTGSNLHFTFGDIDTM